MDGRERSHVHTAEAVIDNGRSAPAPSGSRPAGWPSRPPAPSPPTSTTRPCSCRPRRPASSPKDHLDFFPLTVDVEERMYAAGRDPRLVLPPRGPARPRTRSSPAASSTGRCARRSSRACATRSRSSSRSWRSTPTTCTTWSPSTPRRCRPSCPACRSPARSARVRVALHRRPVGRLPDAQRARGAPSSTWSSPAACVEDGDVAIMMVEAEATDARLATSSRASGQPRRPRRSSPQGLEAAKPFIARARARPSSELAAKAAKPTAEFPSSSTTRTTSTTPSSDAVGERARQALTIAGKQERETRARRAQGRRPRSSSPSQFEGREKEITAAFRSLTRSSSASASCATRSASTAAASPTSASSPPRSRCSRGCTARRCSSAARPRSWASPR